MAKEKESVKTQGELDREREEANRKARAEAAKSQPSLIVHGPAQR